MLILKNERLTLLHRLRFVPLQANELPHAWVDNHSLHPAQVGKLNHIQVVRRRNVRSSNALLVWQGEQEEIQAGSNHTNSSRYIGW
jgi:hypothetical protein